MKGHVFAMAGALAGFLFLAASGDAQQPRQAEAIHVLNRMAYGPRPGDVERVMRIGVSRYIDEQLHPESISLSPELVRRLDRLAHDEMSQAELIVTYRRVIKAAMEDGTGDGIAKRNALYRQMAAHFGELRLLRAIESPRQLEEVMNDFWFNHFNVVIGKGLDHVLIADYEREAIRPYLFGRFRDMLGAVAKHPAMLFYLDNWLSAGPKKDAKARIPGTKTEISGLNENYARELMELHTLGVDGGYTQHDVTELARMLTGWSFNPKTTGPNGSTFRFASALHDFGDKVWLGRTVSVRGEAEGEWALDVLAAHPATSRNVAYKLAQYFVADDPPPALVSRLAERYIATDGDLRAVYGTLFASPEFRDRANRGGKFKTPYRYIVSAVRAGGIDVRNFRPLLAAMTRQGMPLYGCQSPDGYKDTEQTWLNPNALAQRINFATALSLGKTPLARPVAEKITDDPYAKRPSSDDAARASAAMESPAVTDAVLDADFLLETLGEGISPGTRERIVSADAPTLRAALVLGSPDFMRH